MILNSFDLMQTFTLLLFARCTDTLYHQISLIHTAIQDAQSGGELLDFWSKIAGSEQQPRPLDIALLMEQMSELSIKLKMLTSLHEKQA